MSYSTSSSSSSSEKTRWRRMGFLLIFFPESDSPQFLHHHKKLNRSSISIHRSHYFTISIFLLLLLFTAVLLFLLTTLPPSSSPTRRLYSTVPRRHLITANSIQLHHDNHALQRMGIVYRRGARAMPDLIVAHVTADSVTPHDLTIFLRLFLRSTLASRSDLVFIFSARSSAFDSVIIREIASFSKLLERYSNKSTMMNTSSSLSFDVSPFTKLRRDRGNSGEAIWGRTKIRSNFSSKPESDVPAGEFLSYGSVVGFDSEELDPVNSLSGFMDHQVPMNLRRWACYPMLLGRVRRNFKHVMLVDVKDFLLLGDPMTRVRSARTETIFLKHVKGGKNAVINPGVVMGGSRGVRRLSNEMVTAIVRASIEDDHRSGGGRKKKKKAITESGLLNQLIGNESVLKNVDVVVRGEVPVPDPGAKSGLMKNYSMVRRGYNGNFDVDSVIMKHICSFPVDSTVYSGC